MHADDPIAGASAHSGTGSSSGGGRSGPLHGDDDAPVFRSVRRRVVIPDAFFASHSAQIVALAERLRLPAAYPYRYYVAQGGLLCYGVNNVDLFRQDAPYVDRILRGTKPADLPVQQPSRFRLVINLKTAKAPGLTIPQSLLAAADEVIE